MTVDAQGNADKVEVTFYYTAKTYTAPDVTIHCVDLNSNTEIYTTTQGTTLGQANAIYAPTLEGYDLSGSGEETVTVDAQGNADKVEVTFYYTAKTYTAPQIIIHCVDQDTNTEIKTLEQECAVGQTTTVEVPSVDGYKALDEQGQTVTVDAQGQADRTELTFYYQKIPAVALVSIIYRDQDDSSENGVLYSTSVVYNAGTRTTVQADLSLVPDDFELNDAAEKELTVDENGVATPSEVVFYFRARQAAEYTVDVYYRDEAGNNVASPQQHKVAEGNNEIQAAPVDLPDAYELKPGTDSVQYVKVNADGTKEPSEVVFVYQMKVTPTPSVTETPAATEFPYYVEPADGYGYPKGDDINFRSSPTMKDEENILHTVDKKTLLHVTGSLKKSENEDWYTVTVQDTGETGFIMKNKVNLLSQDEVNQLFGYTATPAPEKTAEPTQVPDGVALDRWAVTNAQVNFRKQPSKSSEMIRSLAEAGIKVWVYDAETVNGESWYRVCVGGTDGYLMSKYVDLLSQEESDQYQNTLSTPMPTQGVSPTWRPTDTVAPTETPNVTETPGATATPDATATPAPYRGYALTLERSVLRTGASQTDETVLETVEKEQLILISAQTYVNGVCWDNVEVIATGSNGFMPDNVLRHINDQEAKYYLDNLKPTDTPAPAPTQTAAPVSGYAITLGNNVMLRAFADTKANILQVLPLDTVVMVYEQEYVDGQTWHMVNAGAYWGYIRGDQIRMMTDWEVTAYRESLRTPIPTPESSPTPVPVTENSLSSYGYVNKDKVNMRDKASQSGNRIRLLDQYAFALVLGTEKDENGSTWYHVSQAGTQGYIKGDYFTVLSLKELSAFLTSDNYRNANNNNGSGSTTGNNVNNIQSVEDFNKNVWKNPALSQSYEPFNPYGTATPGPDATATATATATPSPTPLEPTATVGLEDIGQVDTPEDNAKTSGNATGVILLAVAAVLGGGALYVYRINWKNERRRQAVREQQARQAARQAGQPQTRAAQNNPAMQQTRAYPNAGQQRGAAPFMPPSGGARPVQGAPQQPGYRAGAQQTAQRPANNVDQTAMYRPAYPQQQPQQPRQSTMNGTAQGAYQAGQTANGAAEQHNPFRPPVDRSAANRSAGTGETPAAGSTEQSGGVRRVRRSDRYHQNDQNS